VRSYGEVASGSVSPTDIRSVVVYLRGRVAKAGQ